MTAVEVAEVFDSWTFLLTSVQNNQESVYDE